MITGDGRSTVSGIERGGEPSRDSEVEEDSNFVIGGRGDCDWLGANDEGLRN